MLQQTTVVAVVPYFERFLSRFPTVGDLASSDENDVLRMWEGLGYYSRARNLRKCAIVVVNEHGGHFPSDVETLQTLPGIGRYTAGAIVSFAFDRPAPIIEANTLRLNCRLLGYEGDPRSKAGQHELWSFAEAILPQTSPGRFNQALMELGATVCSPKLPRCDDCPVQAHCRAAIEGTQATIPRPATRPVITELVEVSIAIRREGRYLLRRCPEGERWAGLWDFVRFPLEEPESTASKPTRVKAASVPHGRLKRTASSDERQHEQIVLAARDRSGLNLLLDPQRTELKHSVTRYRITLKCYTATVVSGEVLPDAEWQWVAPNDFARHPLSVTGRKFAKLLAEDEAQHG
jgi:A/G-specific adenine glycosylase